MEKFFQIAAVAILVLFYGCYFIKMIQQKSKGIQTDHIGKGKKGIVKIIETTMKVITYILPFSQLLFIFMNMSLLPFGFRCAGVFAGFLGAGVFICSVVTMKDSWRAGVSVN